MFAKLLFKVLSKLFAVEAPARWKQLVTALSPGPTQWSGAQPIRGRHSSQLTNQRRRLSLPSLAV